MQFAAALSDKRGDNLTMNENLKTNMKRRRMIKENITAYLFLTPTLVFYIIFTAVPLIMTIFILSFSEFSLLKPIEFVGLANFRQLFEDPDFRTVMLNTVKFVLIIAPVHIIGGMVLAIAVNSIRSRFFQGVYRILFYFPLVVTTSAIVIVWGYLFDFEFGVFNWMFDVLGMDRVNWLGDSKWSLLSIAIFSAWKFIGNAFLYYFIGLQNIPDTYMEAARVDGASRWQSLFKIQIPMLTPTIFFVVVTTLINCFQIFDETYFLTKGGPGVSSQTVAMHIYRKGFQEYHFGYASTLGLILFVIVLLITVLMFRYQQKWVTYDTE